MAARQGWRWPLHLHLATLFVALVMLVGLSLSALAYRLAHQTLEELADDLVNATAQNLVGELRLILAPADMASLTLSPDPLASARSFAERAERLPMLRDALLAGPSLTAIYVGYDDASFFLLRHLRDEAERATFDAPPGTRFVVQSIERDGSEPRGRYLHFDAELRPLGESERADYPQRYDPRARVWYRLGMQTTTTVTTEPYVFFSNGKVGMTLSRRGSDGRSVVGIDIQLDTLGRTLAANKITPSSQLALVNASGEVLAHEHLPNLRPPAGSSDPRPRLQTLEQFHVPVLRELHSLLKPHLAAGKAHADALRLGDETWRVALRPIAVPGSEPAYLVMASPDHELFAPALRARAGSLALMAGILLIAVPLVWWMARRISASLRQLADEAEAIRHFDFSHALPLRSVITEVDTLADTMSGMKTTIRRFLEVSRAVAAEEDFDRLLALLLRETVSAADAAAGVLYLLDGELLRAGGAQDAQGGDRLDLLTLPHAEAATLLAQEGARALSTEHLHSLGAQGLAEALQAGEALLLPLVNRKHQALGALLLLHREPIEEHRLAFVAALSGSSASSLETRELIQAQKLLFESFIQLIAGAIDAKSPYTGGHCARVPELTKMLARAACAQTEGPFKDFQLDADGWEQLHVAAWLHDCGKVTTPEYVVDKATKLETLYDRLHEVRMRFEVLKRDAEIACLRAVAAGTPAADAEAVRDAELAQLDADFAFVAECNQGGEFMAPERQQRLQAIAQRRWLRTLDDRIGLARTEAERKARTPAAALPAWEPLLADRPEHRIERPPEARLPEGYGFQMAVPELLYHQGELHNLGVARGTLSDEERYKINEHIVQTIVMLERLPFPKHLRQVPEIAGGHHEKMDGGGYPKRLKRDEMSPQARMMAIADIFEALTAADRPYKPGKTLSEAIAIMVRMARDQHIDADLFALFLREGVYLEYARSFMSPEQVDAVDVEACLKGLS